MRKVNTLVSRRKGDYGHNISSSLIDFEICGVNYLNILLRALLLSCAATQLLSCNVAETHDADGLQQYFGSAADASCNLFTKKLQGDKLCPSYGESQ